MVETSRIEVRVAGCREADAPATYSQRGMWWATSVMGEDGAYFNEGWIVPVPVEADLERVTTVLRRVIERFDTFRTTFHERGGELRQVVASSGSLTIPVHECAAEPVEEVSERVLQALRSTGFRADVEWPIRSAIVTQDGRPRALVLVANHIAIDLRGWRVVEHTIDRLMADPSSAMAHDAGWQPVDVAAYESSAVGRAINHAALSRWRRILRSAPATMFDFATVAEEGDRYWQLRMESSALAVALEIVAHRTRVSNSAVLLAAMSTVFGHYAGHDETVGQLNVANRITEGTEDVVGYLCWDSLFYVDRRDASFDEVSRRCFRAALDSYRHGEYDRALAAAVRAEVEHELGARIDLGWQFNDCREATGSRARLAQTTSAELGRLREGTRIEVVDSRPYVATRFYVDAYDERDSIALELLCDTRYVPVAAMHQVLRAIEGVTVLAAERDLAPEEIARSIELAPARRDTGWVRHGKGWVDLSALRRAWRDFAGPPSVVVADPLGDGTVRLVAYWSGGRYEDVRDAHTGFVEALGDRSDICAPDHYARCSDAPPDSADERAWERCRVIEDGSGRRVDATTLDIGP